MIVKKSNALVTDQPQLLKIQKNHLTGNTVGLLYCTGGELCITLNQKEYTMREHDALVILPMTLIVDYDFSVDFRASLLCLSQDIFDQIYKDVFRQEPLWLEKTQKLHAEPLLHFDETHQAIMEHMFHVIANHLNLPASKQQERILSLLAQAGTIDIFNNIKVESITDQDYISQQDRICKNFLDMLFTPGNTNREVHYYAERLNLTDKYLTYACRRRTGRTPSDWIAQRTVQDIQRLLMHSDMNIKEVASSMGFTNFSFFCQYVRKHLGDTPNHLRRKNLATAKPIVNKYVELENIEFRMPD